MKPVLIGSRALEFWFPDKFKCRDTSDYDIITDDKYPGYECHELEVLENWKLLEYVSGETTLPSGLIVDVLSPVGLAIIKRSHLHRDLFFDKHMTQYIRHLKKFRDSKFSEKDEEVLQSRIKATLEYFSRPHPSLRKTVSDFFDDYVTKKYDHDMLHELVAYYDKPLYTKMQLDSKYAWCEKELWNTFTDEDKTKTVAEETYVISIERFQVPTDWKEPAKLSYLKSLRKVCTTLTSGWFRDWAIDHFEDVVELFDKAKFDYVKEKLNDS